MQVLGSCVRMRRSNSLISAAWPRFAAQCGDRRGTGAGQHTLVGCDWFWGHAGMGAEARLRRAWAGWARWGFLEFLGPPVHISCQTPGRVVAPTSGLSRSAERCRKDARSDSRQVPSSSRVRDSGSLSVFRCRAQNPHRGSIPTPDARPEWAGGAGRLSRATSLNHRPGLRFDGRACGQECGSHARP